MKTTPNLNMNERVAQALRNINPYLRKAIAQKQVTMRLPVNDMQYIFDALAKSASYEHLVKGGRRFKALYQEAVAGLESQADWQKLSPEEQNNYRNGLILQGEIIDFFVGETNSNAHDLVLLRSAIASAVGCLLFLLHRGDIENVQKDVQHMSVVMRQAAKEFGETVIGWEELLGTPASATVQ